MAERRMFAKTIIDSDAFLDMPLSTQSLYFHLSMRADDDGFINNPKKIQRMIGASDDDLKILIGKNFIIPFDTGVVVIKHWKIHNYIRNDRKHETKYLEELSMLHTKENGSYTLMSDTCQSIDCQAVDTLDTEFRLGKDSIGKDREVYKYTSCTTTSKKVDVQYANVAELPCTNNEIWRCTEKFYNELTNIYPDVDLVQEFNSMRGWLLSNNRKTIRGMTRFVNNWLNRAQNSHRNRNSTKVIDTSAIDNYRRDS